MAADPGRGFVLKLSAGGWENEAAKPSVTVSIELNGTKVLRRRKFTKTDFSVEIPVALHPTNLLTVKTRGSTSALTVQVVPMIVIDSPQDGHRVSAAAIEVAGHLNWSATEVAVNGAAAVVDGASFSAAAVPLTEGRNLLAAVSISGGGLSGNHSVEIERDMTAPTITLSAPTDGVTVTAASVDVIGSVDDPAAAVTVNGSSVALSGTDFTLSGLALELGANTILVEAVDALGNQSSTTVSVTRKLPVPMATLSVSPERIDAGSVATLSWETAASTRIVIEPGIGEVAASGSLTIAPVVTTRYAITAIGARGVAGAEVTVTVLGSPAPQPAGSFGAGYAALVPEDATIAAYDERRFAVVTGVVTDRDGSPLDGVGLTVQGHPEYGTATTDTDGRFSLPVDGGGVLTLSYRRPGYLAAYRQVAPRWGEVIAVETVALIQQDGESTAIALDGDPQHAFVHRGSLVSDGSGNRAATVVIPGDTRVYARTAGGEVELASFTLRATEFATPEQMPAALPPSSAFTYCVDLSIDGVEEVRFSRPVTVWVDNFLGFDVGIAVPSGYYDRERAQWVASPDGRVVALLDGDGDGAVDALDDDGDGLEDDLNGDGSTADEVAGLSDPSRYAPGATFWRVDIAHLSWWDFNWPWSFRAGDVSPNPFGEPFLDWQRPNDVCQQSNSFVECQGRIYHEDLPIAGTGLTLHYSSARVPGYQTVIEVPVSGAVVPERLQYIVARLSLAGHELVQELPPGPNQIATFVWDGKDHLGNQMHGSVPARVQIGFAYQPVYYATRAAFGSSFGIAGAQNMMVTSVPLRRTILSWKSYDLRVVRDAPGGDEFGTGWTLSAQHRMSPSTPGVLHRGDGQTDRLDTPIATQAFGTFYGDSSDSCASWLSMPLCHPLGMVSDAASNLYVADQAHHRVVRIDPSGVMTVIAGTGVSGFSGDGGPATQARLSGPTDLAMDGDGNLYLTDTENHRIRKVDTRGIITTIAGNGTDQWIDGRMPALEKGLNTSLHGGSALAIDRWGTLYIAGGNASAVLRLGTDGMIETIALYPLVQYPRAVAVDEAGNLYIADIDRHRVLKRDVNGWISLYAGNGTGVQSGDGGPAVLAGVPRPANLMVDRGGNVFIASDTDPGVVRKVDPSGMINAVTGNGTVANGSGSSAPPVTIRTPRGLAMTADGSLFVVNRYANVITKIALAGAQAAPPGFNGMMVADDGGQGYVIDLAGRHDATIDLETSVVLERFEHGPNGLESAADRFGNELRVERDGAGVVTAIVAPDGQTTRLQFDAQSNLREVRYPDGTAYTLGYDAGGLLTDEWDPRGSHFMHEFDPTGRIAAVFDPAGGHLQWMRDLDDQGGVRTTQLSAEGTVSAYRESTDASGRSISVRTAPDGSESTVSWSKDRLTQSNSSVCRDSTQVTYTTDPIRRNRMPLTLVQTAPSGLKLQVGFARTRQDADGDQRQELITETTKVNGRAWTTSENIVAGTLSATSPAGRTVASTYDPATLLVTQVAVPGLLPTQFGCDARGRLVSRTQGGRSSQITWDANGNPERLVLPDGAIREYSYDAMGRLVGEVGADGGAIAYQHDENGNLAVLTNPNQVDHAFDYTVNNQRSLLNAPLSGDTVYLYDRDRRLKSVTLPSGRELNTEYAQGNLVRTQTPEGPVDYGYACGGRLNSAVAGAESVAYVYDGSRITSDVRAGTIAGTIGYAWNNDFALTSTTYAGAASGFGYDADGLLTTTAGYAIGRNAGNGLPETLGGNGLAQGRTFNGYGELDAVTTSIGGSPVAAWTVELRDGAARILRKREVLGAATAVWEYAYDAAGRLTQVTKDDEVIERYTHDANGNRLTEMNALRGIIDRGYTSSIEDHLLAAGGDSWQYDVDGFLQSRTDADGTTSFQYSTRGELLRVDRPDGTVLTYLHDPLGRRIARQVNGTTVEKYLWADRTTLLAVYDGSNNLLQRYSYADDRMPVSMTAGGATYFLLTDQVGTLRAVADTSGAILKRVDYDSFGNIIADSNPSFTVPFGFAGGLHDRDTGLVRFGFRDYDPSVGRFTAKDPIDFAGGDANLYAYVMNDPVNFTDYAGLSGEDVHSGMGRTDYGTYTWALAAGLSPSYAEILARADDGTDGGFGSWMPVFGDQSRHFNQGSGSCDSRDAWAEVEFRRATGFYKKGNLVAALGHLGKGLHSIQDKYAHRDWNTGNLGWTKHPDWYDSWDDSRNSAARAMIEQMSLEYIRRFLSVAPMQ